MTFLACYEHHEETASGVVPSATDPIIWVNAQHIVFLNQQGTYWTMVTTVRGVFYTPRRLEDVLGSVRSWS